MNKKKANKKKPTKAALEHKSLEEDLKQVEDEYKTNLIYNFFNFFIGGSNAADIKNKQEGKPPTY